MGGCDQFFRLKTTDRETAVKQFHQAADHSRYEDGHSYSGGIGMKHDIVDGLQDFETFDKAEEWIQENNDKWGPAHLCRLKDGRYCFGGICSS